MIKILPRELKSENPWNILIISSRQPSFSNFLSAFLFRDIVNGKNDKNTVTLFYQSIFPFILIFCLIVCPTLNGI